MVERRIGIWAAILFLVIASRGCSGGQADGPLKAYLQELGKLVVSDPRMATERHWRPDSLSSYNISQKTKKVAGVRQQKVAFHADLSDLNYGVLKDEMKQAKATVLFSSNKCLLVEATTPHVNFLYQLILSGSAGSPKVKKAFILGGQKRDIVQQHTHILSQLTRTITNPEEDILFHIFIRDARPLLVLQVLDGESCKTYETRSRIGATDIYKKEFLSLFEKSDTLGETTAFEGDEHIQFFGDIKRTSGVRIYKLWMAAAVVREGFDKRVKSIQIIVKKDRTDGSAADALEAYLQELGELVVSDPRKAVIEHWLSYSYSFYDVSLKTNKVAGDCESKEDFDRNLSKLDDVLKGEMKQAKTTVIFSSNKCLVVVVEATQDCDTPPFYFLYQLILDGDANRPKVKRAYMLGGQKRPISQYGNIFRQLRSTITNPRALGLSDIFRGNIPLLVLQVLDGESCETYEELYIIGAVDTYKDKFLSLFGESDRLKVTSSFEGDEHIQFTGDIWSTSGDLICTFFMAAIVKQDRFDKGKREDFQAAIVEEDWFDNGYREDFQAAIVEEDGFDKVKSIYIIVKKDRTDGSPSDAPEKAFLLELAKLVVSDLEKAVIEHWVEYSYSSYNVSLKTNKVANIYAPKTTFRKDLSELDNGGLKDEMVDATTKVLFSSIECLVVVVEATQDSHTTPLNFLYQLMLDGYANRPKVERAFILGGWKREISDHMNIFLQLLRTIAKTTEVQLSHILTDYHPLLALQVLDGNRCDSYVKRSKSGATKIYKNKFLSLFEKFYEPEVTEQFEGDKHIQFEGKIWDTRRTTPGKPKYTFFMAATVVGEGFGKKVQSIHIIVKKEVAEDSGGTEDDDLQRHFSRLQLGAEAMQIDESP